jgi:hypothetical protein
LGIQFLQKFALFADTQWQLACPSPRLLPRMKSAPICQLRGAEAESNILLKRLITTAFIVVKAIRQKIHRGALNE